MKFCIFTILFTSLTLTSVAQPSQKLSKDSARYYQKELSQLYRSTYDSFKNSARYKELTAKLKKRNTDVKVELLANFGLYFTDFKNLNQRLKSIGQKEIKSMVPSLGASLAISRSFMTYGLELNSYNLENSTAGFKGIGARFYLGTNLFKKWPIVLHPQIGYSGSILNMYIDKNSGQVDFDDLFATQANTIHLRHSQDYLDFTLGLKLNPRKEGDLYWQFLRVGYKYGLKETAWKMSKGTINDAPKDRNNQFYLQFCIGLDN